MEDGRESLFFEKYDRRFDDNTTFCGAWTVDLSARTASRLHSVGDAGTHVHDSRIVASGQLPDVKFQCKYFSSHTIGIFYLDFAITFLDHSAISRRATFERIPFG